MTKGETKDLLTMVRTYYGGKFKVDDPQSTFNAWYIILAECDFETIKANFLAYVKTNKFPPSVSDLLAIEPAKDRAIPNGLETVAMFKRREDAERVLADPVVIEEEKAKMRKMLGIERGEQ